MHQLRRAGVTLAALTLAATALGPATASAQGAAPFTVPVQYVKLPNGLKVVLSPDHTAPTAVVAVYYNIGFRNEPRDRTGFAHLFEHMMFQGSRNLGKMEFIRLVSTNGGVLNGSTRFDFTNYFEVVPSNKLETALWAEADRMKGLDITQDNLVNQQGVVKNEVKVNVLNTPYGGFPWLDMPQYANTNWYNSHNFYGDLGDIDAATLADVRQFFATYYVPNNAALAIVGDFDPARALAMVRQYFGPIPAGKVPAKPDLTEPRQTAERKFSKVDSLATRPALAFSYHMPPRNTPEYYAMGVIEQILGEGRDGWLYRELVQKRGLTAEVSSSINELGNMYNYAGPMLWTVSLYHDADKTPADILAAADSAIEPLRARPADQATIDRALVKLRSDLYDQLGGFFGFGRADLLAAFALFDDDPARINRLEPEFRKVTPALVQRTAQEWLRPTNRTILVVEPGKAGAAGKGGN
jgi:predicted Zn-dependent peptidase